MAQNIEAGQTQDAAPSRRTLFFNFSHEPDSATATYYLVAGHQRLPLRPVGLHDRALARERESNAFVRQIPDASLTHVLEGAALPGDAVQLCYTLKNPDPNAGTWSMPSMMTHIPESGLRYAYERARERVTTGPLPISAKRRLYGLRAAETLQDLHDEFSVVDVTDHASTLIALHPNMLSGEPNSAGHIHSNWIQSNGVTAALAIQIQILGDAQPQQNAGAPNSSGWATLVPLTDDQNQPIRNQNGNNRGLIQYTPDWHPAVDPLAAQAATSIAPSVNNDETLGADITRAAGQDFTAATGKMWATHDGFTTVDQSLIASGAAEDPGNIKWVLNDQSVDQGFLVTAAVTQQGDKIQVTLTNANWYLRWIGVWLQFLDGGGNPIAIADLPKDTIPGSDSKSNLKDTFFGTMVPPEFTILAIPVDAGYATITFNMPPAARKVRILGSGLGTGSVDYPDTVVLGSVMTIMFNYGVTTIFLAAGASAKTSPFQKAVIVPIASLWAQEMATLMAAAFKGQGLSDPATWKSMGMTFLKAAANLGGREVFRVVIAGIAAIITESAFEDSIPIAGQILRIIAAIVGIADLLHTTVDVLLSPWSYVYEMVFTHDVSVKLLPDPKNDKFPETANYYKVTALFDSGGTPHVQSLDLHAGPVTSLPPVVFKNVPLGGQISLSTGFYSRSNDPAKDDWLAGKGTTGLVSNSIDHAPDLPIQQYKKPIQSGTVYAHTQKTTLQADGSHVWTPTATPPSATRADIPCAGPGTLCDFRNITVRQGTSKQIGYVGYAWKSYSSGVKGCGSGGAGQFDQMANLNTGSAAQSGYANGPCGMPNGVRLAYNMSGHSSSNFYLDSAARIVRQVQLDPPVFNPPGAAQAWGKFNFDSAALLLHPTGKLVSINMAENRIETLRIPGAAMTDNDAGVHLLAQTYSGQGSRPGLIDAPAAAAISPDGVVLLLEQNNNRIQAFDTGANPVKFFAKQPRPYFLNLDATAGGDTVYLDLAVEFSGYLYVLSYNQASNIYRLDIYHPGQSSTAPISTTRSFNAARLTVDFWRNVYALNYELLQLPGGTVPSVAEPSVSMWIPRNN